MKIVDYKKQNDIIIEFQDEFRYRKNVSYQNFRKGSVKNPYDKVVAGVGYNGEGKYLPIDKKYGRTAWFAWRQILVRCYSDKHRYKFLAYKDCEVCEEWLCYQNFAEWYHENFYSVGTERMHVDKDILVNGNKIYASDTCLIVPQRINMIFMNKTRNKDVDLPTGIRRTVHGFNATYNGKYLGVFNTLYNAIEIYNKEKRIHIKQVADGYRNAIPKKVYDALINW